jgi:molybdopterin adenylyltransferase
MGRIEAICVSEAKGERKGPVKRVQFLADHGIQGDAHAGPWHRQVSLLSAEDIERIHRQRLPDLSPGDFAENLIVSGLDLRACGLGSKFRLGSDVILRLSQIGKVCHTPCRIFYMSGECAMPTLGLFARVEQGGDVSVGDPIECEHTVDRGLYQAVVMTVSDRSGQVETEDTAGPAVAQVLETRLNAHVYRQVIVPDGQDRIEKQLKHYSNGHSIDLVVTVGGTGFSSRYVTSDVTRQLVDRFIPELSEAMRRASTDKTPYALLSRAASGLCKSTLIVNLPGPKRAALENLAAIVDALDSELVKLRGNASDSGESARDEVMHD